MVGIGSMLIICAQMLIVMQKPKGGKGGLGNSKIFLFGLGSGGRSKQN